ncbi:MAG: c-type cytochrome, partial [Mucilaginibacter sp.]|nr:c-type cytochrome [Mucilaginibacter sp.]
MLMAGLAICGFSAHAQGDAAKGQGLFQAKCTACHKLDQRLIGPALGPQLEKETDDKYLIKWIQNNQALIAAKNPKALKIYNEFNQANMTVFADLSDADVTNILSYVRTEYKKMQTAAPAAGAPGAAVAAESGPSELVIFGLIGVIIIAFIVILVLNKVIGTLERLLLKRQGLPVEEEVLQEAAPADRLALVKKLAKNKKFVFFVILCGTIAMGSWTWVTLWNTNVHTGYQPVQPIKFPHDLHAGTMQINCQYCHSGAYKSKNASIPSLNVCMNCHKVITTRLGAKTPSAGIQKIYDALGYDPQ